MPIIGDHPANGLRFDLERPGSGASAPPWHYRGHAFSPHARFALEVTVLGNGEVRVTAEASAPADLVEKTRLLFRALYKQAGSSGAPPRKVVRWRGEK